MKSTHEHEEAILIEKLLTTAEVMKRLRLTEAGMNYARKHGKIPFLRLGRRVIRYRWSEIVAAMEGKRQPLTPPSTWWTVKPNGRKTDSRPFVAERPDTRQTKYFHSEAEANDFAAKANRALALKPVSLPMHVRGFAPHGPFWLAGPNTNGNTGARMKFRSYAKLGPKKWENHYFPTLRLALHDANQRNFAVLREMMAQEKPNATAPATPAPALPAEKLPPLPVPALLTQREPERAFLQMASRPQFTVHPAKQGSYTHVVDGTIAGKRKRAWFKSEAEANTYAHMKNTEVLEQGLDVLTCPAWLRVMAQRCQFLLEKHGKNLEDATRFLIAHLEREQKSCKLPELIAAVIAEKKRAGVSKNYVKGLEWTYAKFVAHIGKDEFVCNVTGQQINEFLLSFPRWNVTTRNHHRRRLCTLFAFGVEPMEVCKKNPALDSKFEKEVEVPVGVFTPEQLAAILANVPKQWVPFIAIGAFAGIRVAELKRLDWSEVDLVDGFVHISAKKAKSARRRIVKIQPVLDAWIRPYAKQSGPVAPFAVPTDPTSTEAQCWFQPGHDFGDALKLAGVASWPKNALRHSFASYHLAHFRNAAELALEMGHKGTDIIFAHYRQVVRRAEAERFWNMFPADSQDSEKVVNFGAQK